MKYKDKILFEKEYGLFKFKVPTKNERDEALGLAGETIMLKKLLSNGISAFYFPIKPPDNENSKNNSWLLMHKEFGQTYTEFMRTKAYYQITHSADTIFLVNLLLYSEEDRENEEKYQKEKLTNPETTQPIPKYVFQKQNDDLFNELLIKFCEAYFNDMKIKFESLEIPIEKLIIRKNKETDEVMGIQSDSLLNCINLKEKNQYCSIYFTSISLFHNVSLYKSGKVNKYQYYPSNFLNNDSCYEMTNVKNRISLISFSEFTLKEPKKSEESPNTISNNSPSKEEKDKEYLRKAISIKSYIKIILRNISLMFGVSNCIYYQCLLNGNGSLEEFHSHPFEICPVCLRKIYRIILKAYDNVDDGKNIRSKMQLYNRFQKLYELLMSIKEISDKDKNQKKNILLDINSVVNKEAEKLDKKNIFSNVNSFIQEKIEKPEVTEKKIDSEIEKREKEEKENEKKEIYLNLTKVFDFEIKWYEKRLNHLKSLGSFEDNK